MKEMIAAMILVQRSVHQGTKYQLSNLVYLSINSIESRKLPRMETLWGEICLEDMNELKVAVRVGQAVDAASQVFCFFGPKLKVKISRSRVTCHLVSFNVRKFCVFCVFFKPRSQVWQAGRSKSPASRREQHRCYSISRMSQFANRFHTFAVTMS